jgi:anti-anti-sigma factor
MEVSVRKIKNLHVFDFDGDINETDSYAKIKKVIDSTVEKKIKNVAVNFSHVTFINSSGIGLFVTWYNKLKAFDGKLYITEPPQNIFEILQLLRIDKIVEIYPLESNLLQKLKLN